MGSDHRFDAHRSLTLVLASLAAVATELAISPSYRSPARAVLLVGGLWMAALFLPAQLLAPTADARRRRWANLVLIAVMILPFIGYAVVTDGRGRTLLPIAVPFIAGLRNIAMAAALFSRWPGMAGVAAAGGLFVVVFSFSLEIGLGLLFCLFGYALAGSLWLMTRQWQNVTRPGVAGSSRGLPAGAAAAVSGALLAAAGAAVLLYPNELANVVPSSWTGILRVGTVYEQGAISSSQRALSQLAERKYGKPGDDAESDTEQAGGADGAKNRHAAARAFSTVRDRSEVTPADLDALFKAQGFNPAHMGVTTYGQFDGVNWQAEAARNSAQVAAEIAAGGSWLTVVPPPQFPLDAEAAATLAGLAAERPLPAIGDYEDVIEWARAVAAAQLTEGLPVLELENYELGGRRWNRLLKTPPGYSDGPDYLLTPYDMSALMERLLEDPELRAQLLTLSQNSKASQKEILSRFLRWRIGEGTAVLPADIRRIVDGWTAGKAPGWAQIEAVIEGLRGYCAHDPEITAPLDTPDTVRWFLMESRRGPDYLFASSAAVLLRSLGYPSRMIGGYYARPENYNRLTGRTAVTAGDVHYWTQTRLADGTWVNLEPTPGYELRRPAMPWGETLARAWSALRAVVARHGAWLAAAAALVLPLVLVRRRLVDMAATLLWRLRLGGGPQTAVVATWRLIERRAALAGRRRPRGRTLAAWYAPLVTWATDERRRLGQLAELADALAHAPGGAAAAAGWSTSAVRELCRQTVSDCTTARLRGARTDDTERTSAEASLKWPLKWRRRAERRAAQHPPGAHDAA